VTRDELLADLRNCREQAGDSETPGGDPESAHVLADEALLDFIGDDEVRAAFDAIRKWYA
jgi:hypothetical protein